jgi:hypothetical protein
MLVKRIVLGATIALSLAVGGGVAHAAMVGPQETGGGHNTVSSDAPLIVRVRGGGHGGGHGGGFHGGGGGFHGGGFHGGGGYHGYHGGGYHGGGYYGRHGGGYYGGGYYGRHGGYYGHGRRWYGGYAGYPYGYYGGYYGGNWGNPYWTYYDWPSYSAPYYSYRYSYRTNSCYRLCRTHHGPKYCRSHAYNYCN